MPDDKTVVSEGDPQAQEPASEADAKPVQEPASESQEGQQQEPSAEIEALKKRLSDLEADLSGTKSAKDKEVAAERRRYFDLVQQLEMGQSRVEQDEWDRKRDSDDPAERDAYLDHLREGQRLQKAASASRQQLYVSIYNDPRLGLSAQERAQAEQEAMQDPGGLTIEGFVHRAASLKEAKARTPLDELKSQLKAREEEIKALRGAVTGEKLRGAEGPERALAGVGRKGKLSGEAYAARLREGMTSAEIDEIVEKEYFQ
ncbi:MAG TPA: hypothetical protein VJA25_06760 [Dehalococcoidia bacterium]|nr:hypothetical protein [Dehalococcoidia bacterium]